LIWNATRTTKQQGRALARLAFALAFDLDFLAPSRGRVEVLRSGQTGMDAGLAALGPECVKTLRQNLTVRVYVQSEIYWPVSRCGFRIEARFPVRF
jgi:hypothetical protein